MKGTAFLVRGMTVATVACLVLLAKSAATVGGCVKQDSEKCCDWSFNNGYINVYTCGSDGTICDWTPGTSNPSLTYTRAPTTGETGHQGSLANPSGDGWCDWSARKCKAGSCQPDWIPQLRTVCTSSLEDTSAAKCP